MNEQFKIGESKIYAEWNRKLTRLSPDEIECPEKVVDEFFSRYCRALFRSNNGQSVLNDHVFEGTISNLSFFIYNLEKLLEAVSVMRGRCEPAQVNKSTVASSSESGDEERYFREKYGIARPVFDKERFYLDSLADSPVEVLSRIFQSSRDDSIKHIVKKWQMAAVRVAYFEYQDGQALTNLLIFCEALQKVIEAIYIICAAWCFDNQSEELLSLNDEYAFLNKKEQVNPYLVVNEFKWQFPYQHVRAEVWDLLYAVSHCQDSNVRQSPSFIENFELLLCMIKAPYLLEEDAHLLLQIPHIPVKKERHSNL